MTEEQYRNELQQIGATLQQFEEYSKQLEIELETLRTYLLELVRSKQTLTNMKDESNLDETLIQIGSGVMLKVKPLEVDSILYNVGAGVVVTKKIVEVIQDIDKKITEVESQSQQYVDQLTQIHNQMGALEHKGQELIQKIQGPPKAQYDPSLVS